MIPIIHIQHEIKLHGFILKKGSAVLQYDDSVLMKGVAELVIGMGYYIPGSGMLNVTMVKLNSDHGTNYTPESFMRHIEIVHNEQYTALSARTYYRQSKKRKLFLISQNK